MSSTLADETKRILRPLCDWLRPVSPAPADGSRLIFNEAMPSCPVCASPATLHQYQPVARTPIEADGAKKFWGMFEDVRSHRWDAVRSFQEWKGDLDDAEVFLLKCPDGRYTLIVIYSQFELWGMSKLLYSEELNAGDLPLAGNEWVQV